MRRIGLSAVALFLVVGLLGCAGGEENVLGLGTITITAYTSPTPALISEIDTITGTGFSEIVGVPCTVRYTASTGQPFLGGGSTMVDVIGTVTSPTTVEVQSPEVVICGPASISAFVTVILPSGVFGTSAAPIAIFEAPTAVSINNDVMGGTAFPAAIPTAFTITGTGYAPVGGTVDIHWTAAASIFNLGGSTDVTTTGVIASSTTIMGVSPEAQVCGVASVGAVVDRVEFPNQTCTPVGTSIAVSFTAPTYTAIANTGGVLAGPAFDAAVPEPFTIVGTGFGPTGGTAQITMTTGNGGTTPFSAGSSATVTVLGNITSSTTITGVSPLSLLCPPGTPPIDPTTLIITVPNGSCTLPGAGAVFSAPTVAFTTNLSTVGLHAGTSAPGQFAAAVPEPFRVTGTGFGPVGGTAMVLWQNNAALLPPPFEAGTSNTILVPATIVSRTTIEGISPEAAFCSPTLPDGAGFLHTVTMPDGACSLLSGFPLGFTIVHPPIITAVTNDNTAAPSFQATNTEPFTVTGDDFGPIGGTAFVTFTSTSAAPADLPFRTPGPSATITVEGTITSRTTIAVGGSPLATLIPVLDAGAGTNCEFLNATTRTDILLEGGSCNSPVVAPVVATFTGPSMTSVDPAGSAPAAAPTDVVSTILLGQTDPEEFVITGTGFGPVLSIAMVTFEDEITGAAVTVPGLVTSTTTIEGDLPVDPFGVRLSEDIDVRVRASFFNGSLTYCNNAVNFVAPPTITSVAVTAPGNRGPFNQAAPAAILPNTWLACIGCDTTISGNGFDPLITDLWFDTAVGDTDAIGAGLLGTIPEPTATAPGPGTARSVTDNVFPTADTINGLSPTDSTLTADTAATVRVVNPDMQFDEAPGQTFAVTGALPNVNSTMDGGTNAECNIAVNPTNPLNACMLSHDSTGGFASVRHSYTFDGGDTWVTFNIGGGATAAPDPFPALGFRFDPVCGFDDFGNYFAVYGVGDGTRDNAGVIGTYFVIVQRSSDGGLTFDTALAAPWNAGEGTDRWNSDTGKDGGILGNQAIYVGGMDLFGTGALGPAGGFDVICSGFSVAPGGGPNGEGGALSAFASPSGAGYEVVNDFGPLTDILQHPAVSVGPNGEVYMSWVDFDRFGAKAIAGLSEILFDADPDGLNGVVFGFGTDLAVADSLFGFFVPIPAQAERGYSVIPMHRVMRAGPNAGRVVLTYTGLDEEALANFGITDTNVLTVSTDSDGLIWTAPALVHPVDFNDQFHPWLAADRVTGNVYVNWYSTENDIGNQITERYGSASGNGTTWSSQLLLSQGTSDAVPGGGNDYLEYNGVDAHDGCVYGCWADNSNFTGDNPNGAGPGDGMNIYVSVYMQKP